jgi:hypothetical protein
MRYTNYILNNDFIDIDGMVSQKRYLKQLTILAALPVAIFGIAVLSGALPIAYTVDSFRYMKLQYLYFTKEQHRRKYIKNVLTSLSVSKDNIRDMAFRFRNIDNLGLVKQRPAYHNLSKEFQRFVA